MKRVLTAVVLIALVGVVLWYAPLQLFSLAVALLLTGALLEAFSILAARDSRPLRMLGIAWALSIQATLDTSLPVPVPPLAALTLGAIAVALVAILRRGDPEAILRSLQATAIPVLLVGVPLAHLVGLRAIGEPVGRNLILLLLLCVYCADTAAYYVGSAIGRRKMAPRLSPKKSWEGAAAALVASVAAALLAHFTFLDTLALAHAVTLGVLLGIAGMFGDLLESVLKRAAGVKDSGNLLPGHGGVLDRIDSLLFSTPILYYYAMIFLGLTS